MVIIIIPEIDYIYTYEIISVLQRLNKSVFFYISHKIKWEQSANILARTTVVNNKYKIKTPRKKQHK